MSVKNLKAMKGARVGHEIIRVYAETPYFECRNCGLKHKTMSFPYMCVGVPIYETWDDVPDGVLNDLAIWKQHKRRIEKDTLPVGVIRASNGTFMALYRIEQGNPDTRYGPRKKERVTSPPLYPLKISSNFKI